MIQVRRGVFETNSSSTHTLSFGNYNKNLERFQLDEKDGYVSIGFGEYATCEHLCTQYCKFKFLLTLVAVVETDAIPGEDVHKTFQKTAGFKQLNKWLIVHGSKGLAWRDNADEIMNVDRGFVDIDGYIDHQSAREQYHSLADFLQQNDVSIDQFVLNPQITMQFDHD